jgi:hypothetical protein
MESQPRHFRASLLEARRSIPGSNAGSDGAQQGCRTMNGKPARRLHMIDAMIFVAATATGIAWGRTDLVATVQARVIPTGSIFGGHMNTRPVEFADRVYTFRRGASRLLGCWTLAVLMVRLRSPRPRRFRLMGQPGMLAVTTAMAYAVVGAAGFLLAFLIRAKYKPTWSDYAGQAIDLHATAKAIAAAWLILALSGRWRPERTWIDRLGCLIGLAWIALEVAGNLFDWRWR